MHIPSALTGVARWTFLDIESRYTASYRTWRLGLKIACAWWNIWPPNRALVGREALKHLCRVYLIVLKYINRCFLIDDYRCFMMFHGWWRNIRTSYIQLCLKIRWCDGKQQIKPLDWLDSRLSTAEISTDAIFWFCFCWSLIIYIVWNTLTYFTDRFFKQCFKSHHPICSPETKSVFQSFKPATVRAFQRSWFEKSAQFHEQMYIPTLISYGSRSGVVPLLAHRVSFDYLVYR